MEKRKLYLFFVLITLALGKPLFAQTDYMFVLERSSANIIVPVFQTLVAALVTDADTLSVVSFSDRAAFLFSPLPGNTPELIRLASERVLSDPLRGTVTPAGVSAAITTANEQAYAWGRSGVPGKLIIITSTLRVGEDFDIPIPEHFANIYYLSIDVPLEHVQAIVNITSLDAAGNNLAWAVDTRDLAPQDPGVLTLADGLFACINAIAPNRFRRAAVSSDFLSFTVGNLLQQVHRAVVLVQNTSSDVRVSL